MSTCRTVDSPLLFCFYHRNLVLLFVAAETGASSPLPSKFTFSSAAIPNFRQCLPSRCLAYDHIPSQCY
jgi:hypothetical protein